MANCVRNFGEREYALPTETQGGAVTVEELRRVLRKFKAGKTGADDGLVAGMVKMDHPGLVQT
eukprot:4871122-Pyramimonas_sp.AAC.1